MMKRNCVVYDDLVAKWAVVEGKAADMAMEFPAQEVAEETAVQHEEAPWPKTCGQTD